MTSWLARVRYTGPRTPIMKGHMFENGVWLEVYPDTHFDGVTPEEFVEWMLRLSKSNPSTWKVVLPTPAEETEPEPEPEKVEEPETIDEPVEQPTSLFRNLGVSTGGRRKPPTGGE